MGPIWIIPILHAAPPPEAPPHDAAHATRLLWRRRARRGLRVEVRAGLRPPAQGRRVHQPELGNRADSGTDSGTDERVGRCARGFKVSGLVGVLTMLLTLVSAAGQYDQRGDHYAVDQHDRRALNAPAGEDGGGSAKPSQPRQPRQPTTQKRGECREVVTDLVDRKKGLIIAHSPRAGSTSAVSVFFNYAGLLADAKKHDSFVHKFRTQSKSKDDFTATCSDILSNKMKTIKVVRCPYARAVASYEHQVETSWSGNKKLGEMIANAHRGGNHNVKSISIVEWLELVQKMGFGMFDVHVKPQERYWEKANLMAYDHVCHIETLEDCLKSIKVQGLVVPEADTHSKLHISRHGGNG